MVMTVVVMIVTMIVLMIMKMMMVMMMNRQKSHSSCASRSHCAHNQICMTGRTKLHKGSLFQHARYVGAQARIVGLGASPAYALPLVCVFDAFVQVF